MDASIGFGLELPPLADHGPLAAWRGAAAAAERAGFGSVWVVGGPAEGGAACDPCTLAGGLVPLTTSLTLGVVSGSGPGDRNPSVLARDVTALDVLSSGRSAVLLQLDPASGVGRTAETWGRLSEAAAVCRLLFTEEAPTFAGRHFRLAGATNRPRPVRPDGPRLLVQVEGPPPAEGMPAADAWVVTGGPAEVAAWRQVLPGPGTTLLWRGELSPGDAAVHDATALHEAGADGLIVRLAATGAAPTAEAVASTARALVPLVEQWTP